MNRKSVLRKHNAKKSETMKIKEIPNIRQPKWQKSM